jgi:hypothetical protein
MSKTKEKAQKYLEQNVGVKEVHATSDGFLFAEKQSALSHSKTLEVKEVATFNRAKKATAKSETLTDAEKETAKVASDKKAAAKKVAAAKKASEAKKAADVAEKAKTNTAGAKNNSANTGADQATAK